MLLSTLQNLLFRRRSLRSRRRSGRPAHRPLCPRLLVERLEDRNLLSGNPLTAADFRNPPSPIGTTFSTEANVNTDVEGIFHNETTIAVNPTNPLNMIGGANDFQAIFHGNGELYYTAFARARVTFDGGQTWTTYPIPFHGYEDTYDPSVSFDADGTAYFATQGRIHAQDTFHANQNNTADDLVVSRSTDGGQTWSEPVRVVVGLGTGAPKSLETINDKPYLTAWGHGNAIITWTQFNWGPQGKFINSPIIASVTHDSGNSWTAPVQISGSLVLDQFSVPAVAADGSISVAFDSADHAVAPQFRHHYEVVRVDPVTGYALGDPVEVGRIYDGSNDYPVNVFGSPTYQDSEFRTNPGGNLTADPTNALHLALVWSDMRNNPPGSSLDPYQRQTNSDILVSQSFDGGAHWSAPAAIATPNDQFQPWGAYDASGRLQIGYYDRSYDPANHQYGYTLASETAPGTLTFTEQQVTTALSDPTQGDGAGIVVTVNSNFPNASTLLGDYSGIAVTPTGVAALWTDMRLPVPGFPGSGEDAFFALVDPPASLTTAGAVPDDPSTQVLTQAAVQPILTEALARWAAAGVDGSALAGIDVRIADLGGATLGLASGHTIWLDANAAGWGWFVDPTPHDDSEFTTPGNQGEQNRMDLLTVLEHELGHVLGFEHTASGVMAETLPPGTRYVPPFGADLGDLLDQVFADGPVAQAW